MRISTLVPAATVLLAASGCACGPDFAATTGDGQQSTESPGQQAPEDGQGTPGSPGNGNGNGNGQRGPSAQPPGNENDSGPPGTDSEGAPEGPGTSSGGAPEDPAEEPSYDEPEEPPEAANEPIRLGLGETHRFEDGFTVSMGTVERWTAPPEDGSASAAEDDDFTDDELDEEFDEDLDAEDDFGDEEFWDEDDPAEEFEDEEPEFDEDDPAEEAEEPADEEPVDEEPVDEEPVDEEPIDEPLDEPLDEPVDEPVDEGDDYFAWSVEIVNDGDEDVYTGSVLTTCFVGDPLAQSSMPLLGESLSPPMGLLPTESARWDEDCWSDEDDSTLQWTLEFIDEEGDQIYATLVFEGPVD